MKERCFNSSWNDEESALLK